MTRALNDADSGPANRFFDSVETGAEIVQAVQRAPTAPGCYIWKDSSGEILYVGKAISLRARLRNYLNPQDTKTQFLMDRAATLEWVTTETNREALILEATLVKKHQPRFNVRLKDDKRYPWICISMSEMYPQIFITRTVRDDGNLYFGPYTDVGATRNTLSLILKIFPIRKVRQKLPLPKPKRPCMNFHIGRCLGPCQGNVDPAEYAKLVE
ncbi:MAG TPA: GIY-YIG nuclease family protein, partial [Leptospiraceae bacterium]|nr:GIY-YIG nuclease family protein [Leptospiraceae bacterium]